MSSHDELRGLADEYWEGQMRASPFFATFLGDHRFDDQVDDLSRDAEIARRQELVDLQRQTGAVTADGLESQDRVTRSLLLGELADGIEAIDLRLTELRSDQMQGIHADLLVMAPQMNAPEPDHARMAVERLRKFGGMLDQATARFHEGLAAGRTPARINIDRSLNQIDGYLSSPVDQDGFVSLQGPAGWDGEAAWREELTAAVQDVVRPGFGRYRAVLADDLLPVGRPDDRSGLSWIPDGPEIYGALIRFHTGVDLSAEEIHAIGMEEVTEKLPAEYAEVGQRLFGLSDEAEIFRRLLDDPDLRYANGDEILADARRCLDTATAAIPEWFGIRPVAPCKLTPVPDFLAADAPGAYYTPPAPDGSRPGEYHVNLHEPGQKSRFETASIAFHEAIPGHHLQLAIASERTDLPQFQRLSFGQTSFVEGWALYTERLAEEMGLYTTDLDRMGMLASDSWRACRLVMDTGLHAMGWSRDKAIDFMVEHAPVSREEVVVEVDRYIGMPGQALAYKIGQREIIRLRGAARQRLGDRFAIQGFHDTVLGSGTVSLAVLRDLV
ncbi:MAG: DUF885 domain-containing protein, partial [Actinomycetota bacterium]|nr:DUF885 domain-containing protein [Actinomycetota bacterium]